MNVLFGLTQCDLLLAADDPGGSMLFFMLPLFVLAFVIFVLPQRKQDKLRRLMLENMKKNDRVVTVGGILGVVTNIDRDKKEVTLKVDEGSGAKLRMTLNSIARVLADESSKQSSS